MITNGTNLTGDTYIYHNAYPQPGGMTHLQAFYQKYILALVY